MADIDTAVAFIRDFAVAECRALVAMLTEPDDAAFRRAYAAAEAYLDGSAEIAVALSFGRRPGMSPDEIAAQAAAVGAEHRPREVFLVEEYAHPDHGTMFACYCSDMDPVIADYKVRYLLAERDGSLMIIAEQSIDFGAEPAIAWEYAGGVDIAELGRLVATRHLQPPETPAHLAHYEAAGEPPTSGPGISMLADLSGMSPDEILSRPDGISSAIGAVGGRAAQLIRDYRSEDPVTRQEAAARWTAIQAILPRLVEAEPMELRLTDEQRERIHRQLAELVARLEESRRDASRDREAPTP